MKHETLLSDTRKRGAVQTRRCPIGSITFALSVAVSFLASGVFLHTARFSFLGAMSQVGSGSSTSRAHSIVSYANELETQSISDTKQPVVRTSFHHLDDIALGRPGHFAMLAPLMVAQNLAQHATISIRNAGSFLPFRPTAHHLFSVSQTKKVRQVTVQGLFDDILDMFEGGPKARKWTLPASETDMLKDIRPSQTALPGREEPLYVNEKHYVLGTPMEGPWPDKFQVCVFANGCFWGSEKGIWRLPGGGIYSTAVGYAAGYTPNPTYQEVCSGRTGHTEAVQVVFDPDKISLVDILRWFWEAHDPTQGMRQGNDRGTQYRSGLYYFDDEQRQLFEASKLVYEKALQAAGKGSGSKITTEIRAAIEFTDSKVFYYGEDYHQQYLAKPGAQPYCSAEPQSVSLPPFEEWAPPALREKYAPKLGEEFWRQHGPTPGCVIDSPNEPIKAV